MSRKSLVQKLLEETSKEEEDEKDPLWLWKNLTPLFILSTMAPIVRQSVLKT